VRRGSCSGAGRKASIGRIDLPRGGLVLRSGGFARAVLAPGQFFISAKRRWLGGYALRRRFPAAPVS
jgi:hypothetical protein